MPYTFRTSDIRASDIRVEVRTVTPEEAYKILHDYSFPRQRDISREHVSWLAHEMTSGTFGSGVAVTMCKLPDGLCQLVNGYHTLNAILQTAKPVVLTVITVSVPDMRAVGAFYCTFDIGRARTWVQGMHGAGLLDKSSQEDHRFLAAVGMIQNGFKEYDRSPHAKNRAVRADLLKVYGPAHQLWLECMKRPDGTPTMKATRKRLQRRGIMGVALETLRYQPTRAKEFWCSTARDDGLPANSPQKALLSWLEAHDARGAQPEHPAAAIGAWNKFYAGETVVRALRPDLQGRVILGTPAETRAIPLPPAQRALKRAQREAEERRQAVILGGQCGEVLPLRTELAAPRWLA